MVYKSFLKPLLFRFDPETVHDIAIATGEFFGAHAATRKFLSLLYGYRGPDISKTVDGIRYRTPILLSAGFDCNGRLTRILPSIGFGGEEVGSITARSCKGNPKPRLTRLPLSKSILVNKGLRNDGVESVINRLKSAPREKNFVLGVSIARTNDELSASIQAGIDDYAYSFSRLNQEKIGDYYAINISCPNAFGGEAFTVPYLLNKLLSTLREIPCDKPVYVKMPINLPWNQFDSLLRVIDSQNIQGVIIGNLNKDYDSLSAPAEAPIIYKGGLSGKPCENPSTGLISKTRDLYGKRFTIMGVGGIMSPETAIEKFNAGADLIQLVTGMIYEGPGLVSGIASGYAKSSLALSEVL